MTFKILFTDIMILNDQYVNVDCKNILNMIPNPGSTIVLLDSESGGGKSTIFNGTINDWGTGSNTMNTKEFYLIIPMLFRNSNTQSVENLISRLFPNATEDIMKCIIDPSLNILFFCDGYDEKNNESNKLFNEIIDLKVKHQHINIIVTSRPESVRHLYLQTNKHLNIEHLKIVGIHYSKREEFLKKYHDELINAKVSEESTEDLLLFYANCSALHKELYRLPIHLVILAWLWGTDKEIAKTITSTAGLYTAILDYSDKKLLKRLKYLCEENMNTDIYELEYLIKQFKEKLYNESLVALIHDRIYIDETGVKNLWGVCKEIKWSFLEFKGAYMLTKLEWFTDLEDTLELPHKGMMDFYAAKCIESKLNHKGKSIKNILLEFYNNDDSQFKMNKFQNVIQLLGGILALKDASLVEEYGTEIISLLIESGIRNNSQWYDIYSNLNLSPTSAEKFGKLIAPYLNLTAFVIIDGHVDVLGTLIQYVHRDIEQVQINIHSTAMINRLPPIINFLRKKESIIIINNISDNHIHLWSFIITPTDKIMILNVTLNNEYTDLPLRSYHKSIDNYCLLHCWRDLKGPAPDMAELEFRILYTAVNTTNFLPTTVIHLCLGLLSNPVTGEAHDPGLTNLIKHCPKLKALAVHIRAGVRADHLPRLPDVKYTSLYLSNLCDDHHLQWSVNTIMALQPQRNFDRLVLPNCSLRPEQLCDIFTQLGALGVTIQYFSVTSCYSDQDSKVTDTAYKSINCTSSSWMISSIDVPYIWTEKIVGSDDLIHTD